MTSTNLVDTISYYLKADIQEAGLDKHLTIVCRQDGMPVFAFSTASESTDHLALGALTAGMWQAALAISNYLSKDEAEMDYRLSFDSTSSGIYVVPVCVGEEKMYLGLFYKDVLNLGQLKMKLRQLAIKVADYWNKYHKENIKKEDGTLFTNITDEEIDNIFAFSGN